MNNEEAFQALCNYKKRIDRKQGSGKVFFVQPKNYVAFFEAKL